MGTAAPSSPMASRSPTCWPAMARASRSPTAGRTRNGRTRIQDTRAHANWKAYVKREGLRGFESPAQVIEELRAFLSRPIEHARTGEKNRRLRERARHPVSTPCPVPGIEAQRRHRGRDRTARRGRCYATAWDAREPARSTSAHMASAVATDAASTLDGHSDRGQRHG